MQTLPSGLLLESHDAVRECNHSPPLSYCRSLGRTCAAACEYIASPEGHCPSAGGGHRLRPLLKRDKITSLLSVWLSAGPPGHPTSPGHSPASTSLPLLSCCGISRDGADFLLHPPPVLALNRGSLFQGDFGRQAHFFPSLQQPFPAPELSPPSSSLCHLMLPFALALFLLNLPLASGSAPCNPSTF